MIADKTVEYNALCLAQYEYAMCPHDVIRVCLSYEHNLIIQCQQNSMWFSRSRHVNSFFFASDSYVGPEGFVIAEIG